MAARAGGQLRLILEHEQRSWFETHTPEGLVQALADLLLEALADVARQTKEVACDDLEDHA